LIARLVGGQNEAQANDEQHKDTSEDRPQKWNRCNTLRDQTVHNHGNDSNRHRDQEKAKRDIEKNFALCGHLTPPPGSDSGTGFSILFKDIARYWYDTIASARKGRGKRGASEQALRTMEMAPTAGSSS